MNTSDVAIIGAGPYGLSVAAHLRMEGGPDVRLFGETMAFWDRQMPSGMLLRSPWAGSHLSDPKRALTLDAYRKANGNHFAAPIPLDRFVDYGRWFQRQAALEVDPRQVKLVESDSGAFRLLLDGGDEIQTRRVVVAAGIAQFVWRPAPFRNLPPALVSHTSEHRDLARFGGKHIAVVGAGQSALEFAALLHESGANVELLVRGPTVRWLWQRSWLHKWPIKQLFYAPPDVGPAGMSHLIAKPKWYRQMPRDWQDKWGVRAVRPAGAAWVKPRLNGVPILIAHSVVDAVPVGDRLRLTLDDGTERLVDHALLGTGYRVDITQYPFLGRKLLASIRQVNGYPELNDGFECSMAGLHFVGAPAAWSFGPLMRFVAGAEFASSAISRRVRRTR